MDMCSNIIQHGAPSFMIFEDFQFSSWVLVIWSSAPFQRGLAAQKARAFFFDDPAGTWNLRASSSDMTFPSMVLGVKTCQARLYPKMRLLSRETTNALVAMLKKLLTFKIF